MTVRPPLATGDDGSANRYPSPAWECYRNGQLVRGPVTESDAMRALAAREVDAISPARPSQALLDALASAQAKIEASIVPPAGTLVEALSTPFDPTTSTATAEDERYAVLVTVDGERLDVPMHIRRGRDYHGTGEYLVSIARRLGVNLMDARPRIADYTVLVEIAEMPGTDCTGDWCPVVLAAATTFRPPVRLPNSANV